MNFKKSHFLLLSVFVYSSILQGNDSLSIVQMSLGSDSKAVLPKKDLVVVPKRSQAQEQFVWLAKMCRQGDCDEVVKILGTRILGKNIDVNQSVISSKGHRIVPLLCAVKRYKNYFVPEQVKLAIVRFLLSAGADTNICDQRGFCAQEIARRHNYFEIAQLLKEFSKKNS